MFVRRLEDTHYDEFKYEVIPSICGDWVELKDGTINPILLLRKYYKNNNGEWEMCANFNHRYITLEALLSNYVVIDSAAHKRIMYDESIIKKYHEEKLEDTLKFYANIQGSPDIENNENCDPPQQEAE